MTNKRRQHSAAFKAKVALSAVRGDKTMSELAAEFDLHPQVIAKWKKKLLQDAKDVFLRSNSGSKNFQQDNEPELYQQIGKLQIELEWLKKSALFD